MKAKILILLFILISELINAQTYREYKNLNLKPGDELIKFSNHFYTGFAICMLSETGLMVNNLFNKPKIGYYNSYNESYKIINYICFGTLLIGNIIIIESVFHVGNAGKLFNKHYGSLLINENGIGIKLPLI